MRNRRWINTIIVWITPGLLFLLAGCGISYSLKEPPKGVTKQLIPENSQSETEFEGKYDWKKLTKEHGLYVFSYTIVNQMNEGAKKSADSIREGLRIWEHKFYLDTNITRTFEKTFNAWEKTDTRFILLYVQSSYFKVKMMPTFVKGGIVYGGHVTINISSTNAQVKQELIHDSLYTQFLERHKDRLVDIPIDTIITN